MEATTSNFGFRCDTTVQHSLLMNSRCISMVSMTSAKTLLTPMAMVCWTRTTHVRMAKQAGQVRRRRTMTVMDVGTQQKTTMTTTTPSRTGTMTVLPENLVGCQTVGPTTTETAVETFLKTKTTTTMATTIRPRRFAIPTRLMPCRCRPTTWTAT